jgi:putative transposase
MTTPARARFAGYRFPAEIIGHAVWLYFRFPLGLRMVEELLAARGIVVSHETVRQWAFKFGQQFANQIRRRLPRVGGKWHLDEVALKIAGVKHLVVASRGPDRYRSRCFGPTPTRQASCQTAAAQAAKEADAAAPRHVMITDKLASYGAANKEIMPASSIGSTRD